MTRSSVYASLSSEAPAPIAAGSTPPSPPYQVWPRRM